MPVIVCDIVTTIAFRNPRRFWNRTPLEIKLPWDLWFKIAYAKRKSLFSINKIIIWVAKSWKPCERVWCYYSSFPTSNWCIFFGTKCDEKWALHHLNIESNSWFILYNMYNIICITRKVITFPNVLCLI